MAHATSNGDGLTAFVFAGGASLASIQAGTLRALMEAGIEPDLVVGTSSGALNAALLAARPEPATVKTMIRAWSAYRRRDLFPVDPRTFLRGAAGQGGHLVPNTGLRRVISSSPRVSALR